MSKLHPPGAAPGRDKRGRTTAQRPLLLSACLIVKDEEANLPSCLAALDRVVDEVVVYDTGSIDGTVEVARSRGARVIEGYWDDDFARARNASLAYCSGRWVLHVDADEILECQPGGLRHALEVAGDVDTLSIDIYNLAGDGTTPGVTHRGVRLFQRQRCHWAGRLHEQVVLRSERSRALTTVPVTGTRIVHSGYLDAAVAERDKVNRNLRVAEAACHDEGMMEAEVSFNLARSLAAAGRHHEALPHFRAVRQPGAIATVGLRMALLFGIQSLLAVGEDAEALEWCSTLRASSTKSDIADFFEATVLRRAGRAGEALAVLQGVGELRNEDGYACPDGQLEGELAATLLDLHRLPEAATVLLGLIERSITPTTVAVAAETLLHAGRSMAELAAAVPESDLIRACAALTVMDPALADEVATSLIDRFGARPQLLAAAVRFAPGLPAGPALEWSARLRDIGMREQCPLVERSRRQAVGAPERLRAAATAWAAFADDRAPALAVAAASDLTDGEDARALQELGMLAPDLLAALGDRSGRSEERAPVPQVVGARAE